MTVPLALRLPKICDGFAPPIRLNTTELADGCKKRRRFAGRMLKLLQFKIANWLTVTLSCEPQLLCGGGAGDDSHAGGIGKQIQSRPATGARQTRATFPDAQENIYLNFMAYLELIAHAEISLTFADGGCAGSLSGAGTGTGFLQRPGHRQSGIECSPAVRKNPMPVPHSFNDAVSRGRSKR